MRVPWVIVILGSLHLTGCVTIKAGNYNYKNSQFDDLSSLSATTLELHTPRLLNGHVEVMAGVNLASREGQGVVDADVRSFDLGVNIFPIKDGYVTPYVSGGMSYYDLFTVSEGTECRVVGSYPRGYTTTIIEECRHVTNHNTLHSGYSSFAAAGARIFPFKSMIKSGWRSFFFSTDVRYDFNRDKDGQDLSGRQFTLGVGGQFD